MGDEKMSDKLNEMNDLLFAQLKRLSSDELTKEQLDDEIERSKAMALVSSQYIASSSLQLRKAIMLSSGNAHNIKMIESLS